MVYNRVPSLSKKEIRSALAGENKDASMTLLSAVYVGDPEWTFETLENYVNVCDERGMLNLAIAWSRLSIEYPAFRRNEIKEKIQELHHGSKKFRGDFQFLLDDFQL